MVSLTSRAIDVTPAPASKSRSETISIECPWEHREDFARMFLGCERPGDSPMTYPGRPDLFPYQIEIVGLGAKRKGQAVGPGGTLWVEESFNSARIIITFKVREPVTSDT